jgi:hypothetical protein
MTCSTNNLTSEDKHRILSVLPKSSNRIFAMARGKIYHAPFPSPNSNDWKPLNFHGAIIFGRDSRTGEHQDGSSSSSSLTRQSEDWDYNHTEDDDPWFRLVELDGRKGPRVVWRQGLSTASSDYRMLVPFFHVFSGNVCALLLNIYRCWWTRVEQNVRIQIRRWCWGVQVLSDSYVSDKRRTWVSVLLLFSSVEILTML